MLELLVPSVSKAVTRQRNLDLVPSVSKAVTRQGNLDCFCSHLYNTHTYTHPAAR